MDWDANCQDSVLLAESKFDYSKLPLRRQACVPSICRAVWKMMNWTQNSRVMKSLSLPRQQSPAAAVPTVQRGAPHFNFSSGTGRHNNLLLAAACFFFFFPLLFFPPHFLPQRYNWVILLPMARGYTVLLQRAALFPSSSVNVIFG